MAAAKTSSQPMRMAVATEAMFGSTMATTPPRRARTPAIVSQRRVRLSSSAWSAVEAVPPKGVADEAVPMCRPIGLRPTATSVGASCQRLCVGPWQLAEQVRPLLVRDRLAQGREHRPGVIERLLARDALALGDTGDELVERHPLRLAACAVAAALERGPQLVRQGVREVGGLA